MRHLVSANFLSATSAIVTATSLTCVAISLTCSSAAAEDEVVVTATRSPTLVERLPARVEIIERLDIEANNLANLAEAVGSSAVQAGGAGQQTSLFLRGANSKHALALFDGVRLNDASTPNGQYDFGQDTLGALERVEILRGPASSIYGSNAVGGVVNMIPRRGGDSAFAPFFEASAGSFDTQRALAGAGGETGVFEYGLSGEWFDTAGYDLIPRRMATHTGDPDGARIATFTASALHAIGPLSVDALVRFRDSEAEFDTFSGGPFFALRADDVNLETKATQALWRVGGDAVLGAGITLRLAAGQALNNRSENDNGIETSAAESSRDFVEVTARYQAQGLMMIGGVSLERNSIETRPPFAAALSAEEDQRALFAIAQLDIGPRVVATSSLRVDDYETFGARTTYQIGAVANWAQVRLFGAFGTAFKAPSLSERFETSFFNIGNPDLDPESSRSWEVGADWAPNETLELGASYYHTRIDDLIEYDFFQLRNINVGEAELDGAEVYVEARPTSQTSLRVSYAWIDARNGVTGTQLARRPENAWRLDANARLGEHLDLALTWSFVGERTDVTYGDAGLFLSAAGQTRAHDVGAVSVNFDLTETARLFARITNVADAEYEEPAAFAAPPRAATVGLRAVF